MVKDKPRGKLTTITLTTRWNDFGVGEMLTTSSPGGEPREWSFDNSPAEVMYLQGKEVLVLPEAITLADIDIGHRLPGRKVQWAVGATIRRAIAAWDKAQRERLK